MASARGLAYPLHLPLASFRGLPSFLVGPARSGPFVSEHPEGPWIGSLALACLAAFPRETLSISTQSFLCLGHTSETLLGGQGIKSRAPDPISFGQLCLAFIAFLVEVMMGTHEPFLPFLFGLIAFFLEIFLDRQRLYTR